MQHDSRRVGLVLMSLETLCSSLESERGPMVSLLCLFYSHQILLVDLSSMFEHELRYRCEIVEQGGRFLSLIVGIMQSLMQKLLSSSRLPDLLRFMYQWRWERRTVGSGTCLSTRRILTSPTYFHLSNLFQSTIDLFQLLVIRENKAVVPFPRNLPIQSEYTYESSRSPYPNIRFQKKSTITTF